MPSKSPKKNKNKSKSLKQTTASQYALKYELEVFGFHIPKSIASNVTLLFITLSILHIIASVTFAFLQEKVTHIEGFEYGKFMTCIEMFTFALCAFLEISFSGGKEGSITSPSAPITSYMILSFCTFGGMFCTNSGLKYISYPTRIIFKGIVKINCFHLCLRSET